MTHTSQTCISDEQNEMWHLELARNLNCHTGVYREAYTIYQKKWKNPSATTGSARKGDGKIPSDDIDKCVITDSQEKASPSDPETRRKDGRIPAKLSEGG